MDLDGRPVGMSGVSLFFHLQSAGGPEEAMFTPTQPD